MYLCIKTYYYNGRPTFTEGKYYQSINTNEICAGKFIDDENDEFTFYQTYNVINHFQNKFLYGR